MDFKNQIVLISGASRGIGRAIAQSFAREGARIALGFHKNVQKARESMELLEGSGHVLLGGDLKDPATSKIWIETVREKMGRLDILVNNAGIFKAHPIDGMPFEQWRELWNETLSLNLSGAAYLCFQAAQLMIEQGGGRIVNISSRGAYRGEPQHPAYGASKAGMNAMSQSMAVALAPYNIFVYTIAPGFVITDMTKEYLEGPQGESIRKQSPMNRAVDPAEIANATLMLAKTGMEYASGCVLDMNGASYLR